MGGVMFTLTTCVFALVLHGAWYGFHDFTLALLFVSLASMLVGFVDDYIKVVKKRNLGLIWWQKILGQVLTAFLFSLYCYLHPMVGSSIIVPFFNVEWDLGIFYVPLMTMVIIFMVNSANLQDGLDGILSSVTVVGGVAWFVMAVLMAKAVPPTTVTVESRPSRPS
jgi:phospho-N-acetylmuramoyl-pentapeptide-transferase